MDFWFAVTNWNWSLLMVSRVSKTAAIAKKMKVKALTHFHLRDLSDYTEGAVTGRVWPPLQSAGFWAASRRSLCSSRSGPALSHIRPGTASPTHRTAMESFLSEWHFPPGKWVEHNKLENICWFGKDVWSCKWLLLCCLTEHTNSHCLHLFFFFNLIFILDRVIVFIAFSNSSFQELEFFDTTHHFRHCR